MSVLGHPVVESVLPITLVAGVVDTPVNAKNTITARNNVC